ncbi:MAG: lysoplasmalogenase [Candidatus Lokiarchaeota archaeon]|nr:lysoplasmalogenase [Candidatus Lokiarchaeota archaeon]
MLPAIFLLALGIATFFNLLGNLKEHKLMTFISKPLLAPFIIGFYVSSTPVVDPLIVLALVLGCAGDVFLLWRRVNPKAIVFGLLSFMIGHVFYIVSFSMSTGFFAAAQWWLVLGVVPYGIFAFLLFKMLEKDLGKMKGAVVVYSGILLAMSFFALSRVFVASPASTLVTWLGSVLFIVSDTILALEYFRYKREILHHSLVMATYISAQLLIVVGLML